MSLAMNRTTDHHLSHPSNNQSPQSQMSVNRIMDTQPQMASGSRQLPPPMTSPTGSTGLQEYRTVSNGRIYQLDILQQPVRARMCGFGDKDRRPITPPPCIRLRVLDAATGQPLDINEIDTSYFVLTVDLCSADGLSEVNLVRHSATSPSISAATATSYPPEPAPLAFANAPNAPPILGHQFYPGYEAAQPNHSGAPYSVPQQHMLEQRMLQAQQASREEAMRIQHEQQQLQNQGHHHPLPKAASTSSRPAGLALESFIRPGGGPMHNSTTAYFQGGMTATANGYYQPQNMMPFMTGGVLGPTPMGTVQDPRSQPGGMFTRNLIGNLAVGAFKLTYPENDLGVWFILQDLSVRTEGSFRLKLNFVNVGVSATAASHSASPSSQSSNRTTPLTPAAGSTLQAAGTSPSLQTGKLNTSSAPILATSFSNEFQVFSAKKFPGVIDSTDLSKAFAKQGIKIPIRKDTGAARGNERRDWDDGDD